MDKVNLIKIISLKSGLKKSKCKTIFDFVIRSVSNDLKNKRNVFIDNFGTFKIKRTEVKVQEGKNKRIVYPPSDNAEFNLTEEIPPTNADTIRSKRMEIVSAVSVEFKITIEESERITDIIFNSMKEGFKKNRIIFIPKFGGFKTIGSNNTIFIPAKKLQKKINSDFSDLETTEITLPEEKDLEKQNEFEYEMSEEFKNNYKEICNSGEKTDEIYTEEPLVSENKILISDELIRLHNEITECKKANNAES